MAELAAELFAHECCLSGEGKWDSGVCCAAAAIVSTRMGVRMSYAARSLCLVQRISTTISVKITGTMATPAATYKHVIGQAQSVARAGYSSGHTLPVMLFSEVFFSLDLVNLVYNNNRN